MLKLKYIIAILLTTLFIMGTHAYAEEQSKPVDHSRHDMKPTDHSDHDMNQSDYSSTDHSDHGDHTDHAEHNDHSDHAIDAMEHSDHADHGSMLQGDEHAMDKPGTQGHDMEGHDMEHADHSDHDMDQSDQAMNVMDHADHADHADHGSMLHGDDHLMDEPGEHEMLHAGGDEHTAHTGDHHHHEAGHIMDHEGGHVMGQNFDQLPSSCDSISEEIEITVKAGREYAKKFPGVIFAFDKQEWRVKPCSKITWHFINEDNIRHQFMVHGLPRYIYKNGMFHLESTGPRKISGTMIVPGSDETYLAHCDMSQHMEKGMKAQLVVGDGGEDLPSIPGLTPYIITDTYEAEDLPQVTEDEDKDSITQQITDFFNQNLPNLGFIILGLLIGYFSIPLITRFRASRKVDPQQNT